MGLLELQPPAMTSFLMTQPLEIFFSDVTFYALSNDHKYMGGKDLEFLFLIEIGLLSLLKSHTFRRTLIGIYIRKL